MDKKNRKQEVLQSVLARFSRILDDIDYSAHSKYKKKLQESGVASSIQILALNDKLSKTMEERAEEIGRRLTPWRYPQEEYKDKNGVTAQCPLNKQIIIQYGFDISTSVFSDAPVDAAQQPDGKRFIKVGNLKGQLIPQLAKIVPNKWGANNMSHIEYFPDEENAIPFELDDNGRAVIDGCQPGKRYYIRMDPFTNQQQVDEWLNGYKRIIQHLSEFLESEWDNVHEQRWQIFDKAMAEATQRIYDNPISEEIPLATAVGGDFFEGVADRAVEKTGESIESVIDGWDFMIDHGAIYASLLTPTNPFLAQAAGKKLLESCQSLFQTQEPSETSKTENEIKDVYFFVQDEVYLYIITAALEYWYEIQSPKDKAYLLGKDFFDFAIDVAQFFAECYVIGKAIPIAKSVLRTSSSTISRTTANLLEKGKSFISTKTSVAKATTAEIIGSLPERFIQFFNKKQLKTSVTKVGGTTAEATGLKTVVKNESKKSVNVVTNAGKDENILTLNNNKNIKNTPPKTLHEKPNATGNNHSTNLDPVSMLTGEELLTLVDDTLFSQFPFVWQRLYRTSAVEFNYGLGYGWSHSLCHTLTFTADDRVIWQNHENNLISFPLPTESAPSIVNLLSEAALYLGRKPNHYLVSSEFGIYHFKRDSATASTAKLVAISDKYGHEHTVIYDTEGKLIALELAGGLKRIALTYSAQTPSLITEVSEFTRQSAIQEWQLLRPIMHYQYNEQQELIAASNALNQTEHYRYGEGHLIVQRQLAGGAIFSWQWQGEGKSAVCHRQITNFNGIESRYEWDTQQRKSTVYQSDGTTLIYIHNQQGKLISETNANGDTTTYEYNDNGQMTVKTDALGGQTHYVYNEFNNLAEVNTPDGQSTYYYWWDEQISEIIQGNRNWKFRYNGYGDRIEEITPEGKKTQYQYNEDGQCIAIIYPDGTKLTQAWDATGQRTQTTYPDGRIEYYTYDAQGRITAISDGQNQTISYTYDSLGQVTQLTYPNKTTREYRYNAYGKVTWFKDESGKVTEYEYASPLHLVTEKRLPNGERLKFRYDNIHLQISEIENQKGEVYHLNYTPTGQLSEEIGFDGIRTTYHYDNAGRIIEKREYGNTPDAEPLVTQYQRDITGRLVRRIFADGVIEQYEYDAYGQLIKVKDGQNILVWEYNLDGQMTAEHQNWATIRHRYDKTSGLLDGTKLPDGQWLEYHHRNGQLRGMTLEGQSLIGMFYDSAGRERERRQGNGLINRYHYDELGQLASHQIYRGFDVELNDTPLPVWQQQYQYEPDGQLAQINGHQARHYRYDKLGQLQTVSYPQANREEHHAEKVELFSYDTTGNKISEKQSLAQLEAKVNRGNRLLFFSDKHFEYDRFGNLITEKRGKNQSLVTHYEYDCRHRLIKVIKPSGQTITYSYDPFNRRTSKTVNGKTTEFIWQGHKLIAETDNDKHWQSYLYEQDSFRPLALVQGNAQQGKTQLYWYQNDQLGTPIGLTDGFGETLYECQYNGYGQIIDETYHEVGNRAIPDNPLRFQGQYYDEETGLHYNLNRYYDPFVGRYITQDPIKLIGGLNFYQYCQNPVNWIDPLGFKNIPGCGNQNPLSEKKAREIAGLEKDQRPANVLEYLSKEYVDAHLALFEQEGASFIVVDDWLVRDLKKGHKTLAPDKFVALRSDMEKILAEYRAAGNDRRILCERLGLNPKDIEGARIYVVHIKPNDIRFKFGMSTGKEVGANDKWLPGGWTSGGIREAILKGSHKLIHNGSIKKLLKYFEKWEEL